MTFRKKLHSESPKSHTQCFFFLTGQISLNLNGRDVSPAHPYNCQFKRQINYLNGFTSKILSQTIFLCLSQAGAHQNESNAWLEDFCNNLNNNNNTLEIWANLIILCHDKIGSYHCYAYIIFMSLREFIPHSWLLNEYTPESICSCTCNFIVLHEGNSVHCSKVIDIFYKFHSPSNIYIGQFWILLFCCFGSMFNVHRLVFIVSCFRHSDCYQNYFKFDIRFGFYGNVCSQIIQKFTFGTTLKIKHFQNYRNALINPTRNIMAKRQGKYSHL